MIVVGECTAITLVGQGHGWLKLLAFGYMANLPIIFHGLIYISLENMLKLWSWMDADMVTAFKTVHFKSL